MTELTPETPETNDGPIHDAETGEEAPRVLTDVQLTEIGVSLEPNPFAEAAAVHDQCPFCDQAFGTCSHSTKYGPA